MTISLFIDAGNTHIKWLESHGGRQHLKQAAWEAWQSTVLPAGGVAYLATVRSEADNHLLNQKLLSLGYRVETARTEKSLSGLTCGYDRPDHLGVDRWLAMLACWSGGGQAFLLVGAGSALTLDWVDAAGHHRGGYIVPGLGMQKSVLVARSEKLARQMGADELIGTGLGTSTGEAIQNGILQGALSLVQSTMQQAGLGEEGLVLSGGDSRLLSQYFPGARQIDHLVLQGLQVWAALRGSGQ